MAFLEMTTNEYGTEVSRHRCDVCGGVFTICPPKDDEKWGGCCLGIGCPSYDITRDIDRIWGGIQRFIERD